MKKKIHYLIMLFVLFAHGKSYSQEADQNIRPAFDLKLFVNDTTFYQAQMEATPYIIKDYIIQVFPGEKIFIEADIFRDSLVNLKVVPEIINKDKTIVISFTQEHEEKIHKSMRLNIVNPFSQTLTYSARINLMKHKKWIRTSVEPVLPKLQNFEIWSDIITTIILYNFHLKQAK